MVDPNLGRLTPARVSGAEVFFDAGGSTGFSVLDFWRWSISDLVLNTTRGILAEYIVAKALGVSTDGVRDPWQSFDLESDGGVRVEVKSAAYVQSWAQDQLSEIKFTVGKRLGWDPETNKTDADPGDTPMSTCSRCWPTGLRPLSIPWICRSGGSGLSPRRF